MWLFSYPVCRKNIQLDVEVSPPTFIIICSIEAPGAIARSDLITQSGGGAISWYMNFGPVWFLVEWQTSIHPDRQKVMYKSPTCHWHWWAQKLWVKCRLMAKLKADRPHPRDYSTHRQTPWTDNDSSLLFAALGKAEPLISTDTRQKFDLDLWPWPMTLTPTLTLTFDFDIKAR